MVSVAYYEDSVVYYARRNVLGDSVVWIKELVDSSIVQYYYGSVALAVDNKANPHVVYSKPNYNYYLDMYYATKDSLCTWQTVLLDTVVFFGVIDTDTLDYPHVVYPSKNNLWHQYWDGSNWNKESIGNFYMYVSLVIDRDNKPHIGLGAPVIYNGQRGGWVGYGVKDSGGWDVEFINEFDVRWPVGIAVDNVCDPHLSFTVYYGEIYHIVKRSGTWVHEDITSLNPFDKTIAIDNMIVHFLGWNNTYNYVRHMWKTNTEWQFEGIHTGQPLDLVVDKGGYLHCIIIDGFEVIYGTTRPQPYIYEQSRHTVKSPQIATIYRLPLKIFLSGFNSIEEIEILDVSGRLVKEFDFNESCSCLIWNGLDKNSKKIRTGVYFLVLEYKEKIHIKKIVIID